MSHKLVKTQAPRNKQAPIIYWKYLQYFITYTVLYKELTN